MFKARPTTYRGIQMRSRLEARYAAWLDSDEASEDGPVVWEYEPRAYASRRGQYLPDFVIQGYNGGLIFVEVKPTVGLAQVALSRMLIILESEPDAMLMCEVPGAGFYLWKPRRARWVWYAHPKLS